MKRLLIALLLLWCGYAEGTAFSTNTVKICSHTSTGYQGLAYDGTNFYTGSNTDDKVYKLGSDCSAVSDFACPAYCAEIDIRTDHDTLIAVSGNTNATEVWEITKDGTKVREWDFSGESSDRSYNTGGLVAYYGENQILLYTCDLTPPYPFKISLYTIADNGTFTWVKTWADATGLGTPQGLYWDAARSKAYYAATATQTTDNRLYELVLNDDNSITHDNYINVTNALYAEIEGIHKYGDDIYYQTWVEGGPYAVYRTSLDAFMPKWAKFNGVAVSSDSPNIYKWNGKSIGKASGSVKYLNGPMTPLTPPYYYCNNNEGTCADSVNGANLMCEVWNSTADGVCNWLITETTCTIDTAATPDNDPALGCLDIRNTSGDMTYIYDINKTAGTNDTCRANKDIAAQTTLYIQFYIKIIAEGLADTGSIQLFQVGTATTGTAPFSITLYQKAGGNLYFHAGYHVAAGWSYSPTFGSGVTPISLDTWYGVRIKYDQGADPTHTKLRWYVDYTNNGVWTDINGSDIDFNSDRTGPRYVILGEGGSWNQTFHDQITGIKISTTGFPNGCQR